MILPFSSTIDCTGSSFIRLLNCWLLLFSHQTVTPLHIGHDATQPHSGSSSVAQLVCVVGRVLLSQSGHSTMTAIIDVTA